MPYVDLFRRFRDLTPNELESPELLASFNEQSSRWADGWAELLRCPRVVLLAEAGSGKSEEMREQVARLMAAAKPAFHVALEWLDHEPLAEILSTQANALDALASWKSDGQTTAWFFLDAVDELKLTGGKLERALGRLAKEIDGHRHRAHVVISCRPSDWRPAVDLATVRDKLPITPAQPIELSISDEAFLSALRDRDGARQLSQEKPPAADLPRVVILLPLSEHQIVRFAAGLSVADTAEFIAEIRRRDAWTFARRPLDLMQLITFWQANKRLGTRLEQHDLNVIAKLRDNPERPDRGALTDEGARFGAERLALALALTRTRTIRTPEQALVDEDAQGMLDPSKILINWSEEQRQSLLRRALFDPATYGRVRFHHRSVQEYLAARRLQALREKGMPVRRLCRLLFAERYGLSLVIPSMQAIAAWLALWDADVRRELMGREPETLLSLGDPESLPIPERSQLLRAFATTYGEGGWRGLHIPMEQVRRLAAPELAGVVRELWNTKPSSPDVIGLLLEMIWQGPIERCADIASEAVFDDKLDDFHRMAAIRALVACGKTEVMREVSNSILYDPAKWPDRVVHLAVEALFPAVVSIAELIQLIERAPEPKTKAAGFSWAVKQVVERIEPSSQLAWDLRYALADLVWRGRHENQDPYRLKGRFDHIAPALARLCDQQLETKAQAPTVDRPLIWASVVANRFGDDETGDRDLVNDLKKRFKVSSALREAAFWCELELTSEVAPAESAYQRFFRAEHRSLVEPLSADDYHWLREALCATRKPEHRSAALFALARLWISRGRKESELGELEILVSDDSELKEVLRQASTPPEPNREYEKSQRERRQWELEQERLERQRLEEWSQWRKDLLVDPDAAFKPEVLEVTTRNLFYWLRSRQISGTSYDAWNVEALRKAFGERVTALAAKAFQEVWRAHSPTLKSKRPQEERNKILSVWIDGLTGLTAEARNPGWAARLTDEEARLATAYATIEMNGFSDWLPDVAAAHPLIVCSMIEGELVDELSRKREHSWALQNLSRSARSVKQLLTPTLLDVLASWPTTFHDEEDRSQSEHRLAMVLSILDDAVEDEVRGSVADLCERQFSGRPIGPLALAWLRGLFRFDPARATEALEDCLKSIPDEERDGHAIEIFARMFGPHGIGLNLPESCMRATILGRLIRSAYQYVRVADDQEHEGIYSPDTRDNAERARGSLLASLLDTPGEGAQKVIRELLAGSLFGHQRDHLLLLARQRAARDAEPEVLRSEDVLAFEERFEIPPHDRNSLFLVMVDRLEDLANDIAHHDFSDRRALCMIRDECDIQHTLAYRLTCASRGAYVVSREEEVADCKRTDIRLAVGEQKAVIEVKIADKWSLAELEQALRSQLVGQYLRHDSCKAGCLLLSYSGKKRRWKHPQSGRWLSFPKVVEYLSSLAVVIEKESRDEFRLSVYAIDLTESRVAAAESPLDVKGVDLDLS